MEKNNEKRMLEVGIVICQCGESECKKIPIGNPRRPVTSPPPVVRRRPTDIIEWPGRK